MGGPPPRRVPGVYPCKLFESCLVCDLKIPIPIGEYEFGIARIPASVLHVEFEEAWDTPFPLGRFLFHLDQLCKLCVTGRHRRLQNLRTLWLSTRKLL